MKPSTPPSHDEYRQRRKFASLDGLRCAAILAVVWHHTGGAVPDVPISGKGFLGVDLFFVISGFLIVTLLLRERDHSGRISLRRFYIRRTLRIFPIYYLLLFTLAFVFVFVRPQATMADAFLADLPYHLTYTTNFIHAGTFMAVAWSLATEEQFYLVWPLVEKYGRAVVATLVVAFGVNQTINFGLFDTVIASTFGSEYVQLEIVDVTFAPILLGVALAHVLHNPRGYRAAAALLRHRVTPVALLVGIIALCQIHDISGAPRLGIHLLMTALLAATLIDEGGLLAPFLRWPLAVRIGVVSYGVYLYHHLGRHAAALVLGRLELDLVGAEFLLTLLVTLAMAEASYRLIETPFLRLKARFSSAG